MPNTSILTELEALRMICAKGIMSKKTAGNIRAKGKCPICEKAYKEIKGIGFLCLEHQTVPKRLYVDLPWKGERIRIFSDKQGKPLDTYARAEEVLKHLHYEISNNIFDPTKYIVQEASKFWAANLLSSFEKHKLKTLAPGYRKYFSHMVGIAKDYFKIQDVREIRKIDLINYREHLESFSWKPKTLKNVMDVFKAFLYYLKNDLELIKTVPSFPVVDVPDTVFRWLEQKDQIDLFEKVPDQHKPFIAFLMLHGCRPGEARALRCKNIDIEHGNITIMATFSGGQYCERRKGRGARVLVIPIHSEMVEYLANRISDSHPEAYVFVNPTTGRPYTETKLQKLWTQIKKAAGVSSELRLYDACRHSFASQLVNSGVSLFTVSKLLGHSSTKMTEKYSHANLDSMRTELSKLSLKTVTNLSPAKNYSNKS